MIIRMVNAKDFSGRPAEFAIIWETVCMSCTFAVGVQTDKQNRISIFHVTNMDGKDIYTNLDTYFLDIYQKYNISIVEKVKKEMKKVIMEVLTARLKSGMITIEQIEFLANMEQINNWAKGENI